MTHEEVMAKLNEIFRDVFDDDSITVTETTTANDIKAWDSLEPSTSLRQWNRNSTCSSRCVRYPA